MSIEQRAKELISISVEISKGNIPEYQSNEIYTSGAYDLLLLNQSDAVNSFNLLQQLCNEYKTIERANKEAYLGLLTQAAHAARTTELPIGMQNIITANKELAATKELAAWYRIKV
ncbi:hypothetical protein [Marinomonas sp. THO17]|uniref:hypothetical protein n=1 Tax=Marinomonas sp. THO17 TaxID=3149048 RepID=UPI00336C1050